MPTSHLPGGAGADPLPGCSLRLRQRLRHAPHRPQKGRSADTRSRPGKFASGGREFSQPRSISRASGARRFASNPGIPGPQGSLAVRANSELLSFAKRRRQAQGRQGSLVHALRVLTCEPELAHPRGSSGPSFDRVTRSDRVRRVCGPECVRYNMRVGTNKGTQGSGGKGRDSVPLPPCPRYTIPRAEGLARPSARRARGFPPAASVCVCTTCTR
eukprot:1533308-Pyramimonas_sp.AAC.2